jgi:uncharacterized protein
MAVPTSGNAVTAAEKLPIDFAYALHKLSKCLYIYIGETEQCGLGIFAAKPFFAGEDIVVDEDGDYYDRALTFAEVQDCGYDIGRDCIQVGANLYNLPNGNLDDIMNHSCDPSTGLRLTPAGYRIVALRDLAPGDELTYDYSTYISGGRESLICRCGAAQCRGLIGSFAGLPAALQQRYLRLQVVGEFATEPMPEAVASSA